MPRKLVEGEEANGRPDVSKLWCGFDRGGYGRIGEECSHALLTRTIKHYSRQIDRVRDYM